MKNKRNKSYLLHQSYLIPLKTIQTLLFNILHCCCFFYTSLNLNTGLTLLKKRLWIPQFNAWGKCHKTKTLRKPWPKGKSIKACWILTVFCCCNVGRRHKNIGIHSSSFLFYQKYILFISFFIPLLHHFTISGQENAQNMTHFSVTYVNIQYMQTSCQSLVAQLKKYTGFSIIC